MSSPTPTNSTATTHAQPIPINTSSAGLSGSGSATDGARPRSSSVWSNPGLSPSTSPISTSGMSVLQTPVSTGTAFPRQQPSPPATTSPLSYFLPSSPVLKTGASFPWTSPTSKTAPAAPTSPKGTLSRILSNPNPPNPSSTAANNYSSGNNMNMNESAIAEDDDPSPLFRTNTTAGGVGNVNGNKTAANGGHFRSGSLNLGWGNSNHAGRERAAGVMRRLSLSGALGGGKPTNISPPSGRVPSPPMPTPVSPASSNSRSTESGVKGTNNVTRGRPRGMSDSVKKRGVSPMGERMLKGHFDGFGL